MEMTTMRNKTNKRAPKSNKQ